MASSSGVGVGGGVGVGVGGDVLLKPTKGSDVTKDVTQLIGKLDTIYELHSFLPLNPEKDLCVTYLQSGICTAKCNFHHPLVSRPAVTSLCPIYDFIYIFERAASLLKIVSHDATQDIANVIKPVCKILTDQFETYITEYKYGDMAYLYDECALRILTNMRTFLNKKPSPKQYFKKVYNVKPPTNSLMEICITEVRVLHDNFQKYEDSFYHKTEESLASSALSSGLLNTLTSDLLTHADTAQSLHDMNGTGLTSLLQKVKAILDALWKTPTNETVFDISPCGLTPSALCVTPHTSPLCFVISRDVSADSLTPAQTLETIAMALANNGFSVVENNQTDGQLSLLTVVLSEQEQNKPQQLINLVLNDRVSILSTQLFASYKATDPRVRPLVLAVQQWARVRGCNDPDNATLSLYGWTLLVLNFLQQHTDFTLPNLQKVGLLLQTTKTTSTTNEKELSEVQSGGSTPPSLSLAPLLIQFFLFYGSCASLGFQPFHAIATLRNDHKVFKRDTPRITSTNPRGNDNNATVPCMTAQEAIQALCPGHELKPISVGEPPKENVPATSDSEFGNEEDNDHTDREISSNTSHHSRRGRGRGRGRGGTSRPQMLMYSASIPSWRWCIEDPLAEVDVGADIFCRTGQAHLLTELRRAVMLFQDIASSVITNATSSENGRSGQQSERNFWHEVCIPNGDIPQAAQTCPICGQSGHRENACTLLRCQLCNETGHFLRDCLLNFCSNCRKQGHFAKECDLPKTCRNCKQPGHLIKECPHKVCAKCGSHEHVTTRCSQKGVATLKDKPHHKRTKSKERTKSIERAKNGDINSNLSSSAEIIQHEHEILPARLNRFDSFDADLNSLDSRGSGNSSRSFRRRKRSHQNHPHPSSSKPTIAEGKQSKPLPKEKKLVVPSLQQANNTAKSRMPWFSSSNSTRPQVNTNTNSYSNTNNAFIKQKFFNSMYSPQSSPYASPRDYHPAAPGKMNSRAPGAMLKPSAQHQQRGAKPSHNQSNGNNSQFQSQGGGSHTAPRSRNRSRGGSISATTSAGYVSAGYSSASPRNYIPPSPISTPTAAASSFHKADSKLDSIAYPKLPAKPQSQQSLTLQKKPTAPTNRHLSAKADSRDRSSSVPGSPIRSMHDIKLSSSSSSTSSENRNFTTPYTDGAASHSSPDSSSPSKKQGLTVGEQQQEHKKELKKEKKQSSQRNYRKKQAKRVERGAKTTTYIDNEISETEGSMYTEYRKDNKMSYAKATMQQSVEQKLNGRLLADSSAERYSYDKAEEKSQSLALEYGDYLDYI